MLYLGNEQLLGLTSVGFLCSRQVVSGAVLRCYDWALAMRESGTCVMSGFHSPLEQDVLHFLLKGHQPVIAVLSSKLKTTYSKEMQLALDEGRLLIVSPFETPPVRPTATTAQVRNEFIFNHCQKVVIGYASKNGQLWKLSEKYPEKVEFLWEG
jgi:predicted Rossmann fold nucleotide-binding protein DprA/Smf involved in DNA uptake